jgi:adenosylmethionine-8-amino-7-oxononanoate aminotransferase
VSDLGLYSAPYQSLLFDVKFLKHIPYVNDMKSPLWTDCESEWAMIEAQLLPFSERLTAIVIEPIVQAAGGMKIYSQDFLRRLKRYCQERNIHLIADEIMTGIGRTGKMLACEHAEIEPDFLCLAKGLTSGFLPLSAVLTTNEIYQYFYDDYEKGKSFLHSHTQSGNALASACALQVLTIFAEENILEKAEENGEVMYQYMQEIADYTKKLTNVRSIGAMTAADLISSPNERKGYQVFREAIQRGALLRPLGNTIYWLPPLTVSIETLSELKEITEQAIVSVF